MENAASGNAGQPMFRAMKEEVDGPPKVGRSARELGVRIDGPTRDLPVGKDGTVEPATGGMSVALDAAQNYHSGAKLPRSGIPQCSREESRRLCSSAWTAIRMPSLSRAADALSLISKQTCD